MRVRFSVKGAILVGCLTIILIDLLLIASLSNVQHPSESSTNDNSSRLTSKKSPRTPIEIRPIIVLSTFRTGSTLAGEIIQQAEDSFYLYEPLNPLNYVLYQLQNATLHLVNGSVRYVGPYDFPSVSIDILKSLINCDFSSLDIETASHGFLFYSRKSIPYISCVNLNKRKTTLFQAVNKCLHIWKESCESSKFRIIKVVRLSLDWMEKLLQTFPNLVVVHLVRDPRAIQISRSKLGENIFEDIRKSFTELCTLLSWNIYFETRLNGTYGRIFRLYYEKLALRPLETSMWLYKRLALRYTPNVRAHVHRLTRAGLPDECPTCAGRANSSAHVQSWKGLYNQSQLNDIEEVCGTYLKELGYS
uniref:Carbohydrate sulfotransferase 1-like n=1 Tax=Crassostrea virginica TaxID=6565 RepID=A0A8B8ASW6_CRAVI|nr:carbohydrate sulfotransferase 1-like [Crassostrea virginica]